MPLSRDEVIHGFRLILGREPESESGIAALMQAVDADHLATLLLCSPEFRASARFKDFLQLRDPPEPVQTYARRASFRTLLLGNAQVQTMAAMLQAMTGDVVAEGIEVTPELLRRIETGEEDLGGRLEAAAVVYVQMADEFMALLSSRYPDHVFKVRRYPPLNYGGFHPDCVRIRQQDGSDLTGVMGVYHSSIAFWGWSNGWSVARTLALFNENTYATLDFYAQGKVGRKVLQGFGGLTGIPLDTLMHNWDASGVWMHTPDHPRVHALAGLAAELLRREGIEPMLEAAAYVDDQLARRPVWPVYPELAARLGVTGSYLFKTDSSSGSAVRPHIFLSLEDFVTQSFELYGRFGRDQLRCDRLRGGSYSRLSELREVPRAASSGWLTRIFGVTPEALPASPAAVAAPARNPHAALPDHQVWRRAVEKKAASEIDPVAGSVRFRIERGDQVATAGSRFAHHFGRMLSRNGMQHLVTEAGADLSAAEREQRQFGLFSARYGNIDTPRQLVQLFERVYGRFLPLDTAWQRPDGRWVDPFRPQVEPDGYATQADVVAATTEHLAAVRRMFEQMHVFIFTLSQTEAWQRKEDGSVFPLAPGVVAGGLDPARHAFVNFGVAEVVNDIRTAVLRLRSVNPRVRVIFTVSPVPLMATYQDRHVLVSTAESKAIVRAAIGEVVAADPGLAYFPSYEIITGNHTGSSYFAPDLRSVNAAGIAQVTKLFMRHYAGNPGMSVADVPGGPAALEAEDAARQELASEAPGPQPADRQRGR